MSITLQDFIFLMLVYFAKKLYLDKTKRFREIVKVLDEVGIRSVTQVIELNQVAKLYRVCAQDNKALRFRAAESLGNFGIESRGSLRAVIFKVTRSYQGRTTLLYRE